MGEGGWSMQNSQSPLLWQGDSTQIVLIFIYSTSFPFPYFAAVELQLGEAACALFCCWAFTIQTAKLASGQKNKFWPLVISAAQWKLNKPGICCKCEGNMREDCQLSYHFSLSFVLFYFGALPNPPHSGCPVNMCKHNMELSRKGRNTKSDLAWQQGKHCCGPCNLWWWATSVSLNLTSPSGGDPGQRWLQEALKRKVRVANTWLDSDFCTVHPNTFSVFPNTAQEGYEGEEITALSLPGLWPGSNMRILL